MKVENNMIELPQLKVAANSSCNVYRNDIAHVAPFDFLSLEISEECHPHFVVTDVKVGRNSQLYSCKCLPASLFVKSRGRPYMFAFDRVLTGQSIYVSLTNITTKDQVVRVYAEGYPVKTAGPGAGVALYGGPRFGICGLGHTVIPARSTVDVESWSQVRYAPSVLHVPPHLLGQVEIVKVVKRFAYVLDHDGKPVPNPDVASYHDKVPEQMLSADNLARGGVVKFRLEPIVTLAEKVFVSVQNLTDRPVAFTGALLGESVGRMDLL